MGNELAGILKEAVGVKWRRIRNLRGGTEKATKNVSGWPVFKPGISVKEVQSIDITITVSFLFVV